jgi:hypothetical protein
MMVDQSKAGAIDKAKVFVIISYKDRPGSLFDRFANTKNLDAGWSRVFMNSMAAWWPTLKRISVQVSDRMKLGERAEPWFEAALYK